MVVPLAWRGAVYGAAAILIPGYALAQTASPPAVTRPAPTTSLDPQSPMAPLPELGVAWPDLNAAPPEPADPGSNTVSGDVRYDYRIDGIDDIGNALLRERFHDGSNLEANRGEVANAAQIDRRAREDSALLVTLLRAAGYYDARVSPRVEPRQGRPLVVLEADPGTLYTLNKVTVPGLAATGEKAPAIGAALGLKAADAVDADTIVAGQAALRAKIGNAGYPFAQVGEPEIVVDHATHTATLDLAVTPGAAKRFHRITANPNNGVFGAKHIQEIARFRPGQPYNASSLDDLRRALIQTSLVSVAEVKPVDAGDGLVDIDVHLAPAPPRTIAGELGYGTGEGARAEVDWTHRNLFPPEGALTLRGVLGTQEQLASIAFKRSNFHVRDHVLNAQVAVSNTQRVAYRAKSVSLTGSLEQQTNIFFQKRWSWSVGGELTATDERDTIVSTGQPRRQTYFIVALPLSLNYDGTDDLLDPHRGFRLGGRLSPELSLEGRAFGYARAQIDASAYQPIGDRVVLAGRVRVGTIAGAPRDAVAPSRRFYAGGGGSVRGYAYQAIGPTDVNGDPIGGRSIAEFGVEARIRTFGNLGVVPFFDGGNIYTSAIPGFTDFRYGTGLGLRYYSNFGPIRLDVGTPIDRRPGESLLAVYVSLGQAF